MSAQFAQLLHEHYDLTHTTEETHAVPEKGWTVTTVEPVMPDYDTRTSTDRIDELNAQMAALRSEFRALSEQMAGRA